MPRFYKNVKKMMTGVVWSQLISILLVPVIARLYNQEDFGLVALFLSVVTILVVPATLRLEHAINLPSSDDEAVTILTVSLNVLVIQSILFLLLILLFYLFAHEAVLQSDLGLFVFYIPVGVLLLGVIRISMGYAVRKKHFKSIGNSEIAKTSATVGSRIALGVALGSNALSLIATLLLGYFIKIMVVTKNFKSKFYGFFRVINYNQLKLVIKEYYQFPLYSVPTGLLKSFNDNYPVIALAMLFESTIVGLYAMALRFIQLPVLVVSEPVKHAYLQKVSVQVQSNEYVLSGLLKITLVLFLLGFLVIVPLAIYGQEIFSLLLGEGWAEAGSYAAILSPWFVSMFVQSPASCVYMVFKRQKILFYIQCISTILLVLIYGASNVYDLTVVLFLALISIVGCLSNIVIIAIAFFIGRGVPDDHSL